MEEGEGLRSTSTKTHSRHGSLSHPPPPSPYGLTPCRRTIKRPALLCLPQSRHQLHQTATMKFVALALALLLAVGSQAASLQADAPSQLQHIRSVVDMYLTQVKEGTKRALDKLDGTPYGEHKVMIAQRLDDLHNQMKVAQQSVAPMTDSVVKTLVDATAEVRTSIMADIDALKVQLEPKTTQLREVLEKHFQDYRTQMEPIMKEYMDKHNAEMEAMKVRMQPVMDELRTKVETNLEETKSVLLPMVETVRTKITERLENLRAMAAPYVEEYKDQARQAYSQASSINAEQLEKLREKITPLAEDIKLKLQAMFEAVSAAFTQN